jgi:YcaO-like protein with predicted kinase domain
MSTHRACSPSETLERLAPLLPQMGITRLATVTGLDDIGLPVVMAVRPNSRGLAVAQGKGLTLAQARVSAVMEAAEAWHAERVMGPVAIATEADLAGGPPVVPLDLLPVDPEARLDPSRPLPWIAGQDLLAGAGPLWVPYDLVHTRFTGPALCGPEWFRATSNGLGAGNTHAEAVAHALAEVIERDASTWALEPPRPDLGERQIDLGSVDDPDCRLVLDLLERSQTGCAAWEVTADIEIPVFRCVIVPREDDWRPVAAGAGAHPRRGVALCRALLEAVQSRLTLISGSRDDCDRSRYAPNPERDQILRWLVDKTGPRPFTAAPSHEYGTAEEDAGCLLRALRAARIPQAAVVDLTRDERLPVVRVVVPGLRLPQVVTA